MVTSAWSTVLPYILTSAININISLLSNLTTYHLYDVADYDCPFIRTGAPTEAAQLKPVCQDQSMSASA